MWKHHALDLNQRVKVSHKVTNLYVIWQWLSGIQDKSNLKIEPCTYCLPGSDKQRNPTRRGGLSKLNHFSTRRLLTSQKLHVLIKGQLFLDNTHSDTIVPHLMGKTGLSCCRNCRASGFLILLSTACLSRVTHTILPSQAVLLIYMYEVTEDLKMRLIDKWTNKTCRPQIMSLWGMWRTEIRLNPTLV